MVQACFGRFRMVALAGVLLLALSGAAQALSYEPVDFSSFYNATGNLHSNINTYPTGAQTYLGIPFQLGNTASTDYWHSYEATGAVRVLTIPVNIMYAREVHTLINTFWGEKDAGTFAYIEFFGTNSAYFRKNLDGNDDIRDYNFNPTYTTLINGTTTQEVWNNGSGQHIDKQVYALPDAFATETLTQIQLVDLGRDGYQRTFLYGCTVGNIPIPGAVWLLGSGLLGLLGLRRVSRR